LALKWIEIAPENIGSARWFITKLFETGRPDVIQRITVWDGHHPDHPIAEKIERKLREM
jgi:hypothetical protein